MRPGNASVRLSRSTTTRASWLLGGWHRKLSRIIAFQRSQTCGASAWYCARCIVTARCPSATSEITKCKLRASACISRRPGHTAPVTQPRLRLACVTFFLWWLRFGLRLVPVIVPLACAWRCANLALWASSRCIMVSTIHQAPVAMFPVVCAWN